MRELSKPDAYYLSVLEIDFKQFKGMHLISDWDGPWVPYHGSPNTQALGKLEEAVSSCKSVSILSNCSAERELEVREHLAGIGALFFRAQPKKPHPDAFGQVFKKLGLTAHEVKNETLYIGDRVYTDTYGANRAGIANVILVSPLPGKESLGITLMRWMERQHYGNGSNY